MISQYHPHEGYGYLSSPKKLGNGAMITWQLIEKIWVQGLAANTNRSPQHIKSPVCGLFEAKKTHQKPKHLVFYHFIILLGSKKISSQAPLKWILEPSGRSSQPKESNLSISQPRTEDHPRTDVIGLVTPDLEAMKFGHEWKGSDNLRGRKWSPWLWKPLNWDETPSRGCLLINRNTKVNVSKEQPMDLGKQEWGKCLPPICHDFISYSFFLNFWDLQKSDNNQKSPSKKFIPTPSGGYSISFCVSYIFLDFFDVKNPWLSAKFSTSPQVPIFQQKEPRYRTSWAARKNLRQPPPKKKNTRKKGVSFNQIYIATCHKVGEYFYHLNLSELCSKLWLKKLSEKNCCPCFGWIFWKKIKGEKKRYSSSAFLEVSHSI